MAWRHGAMVVGAVVTAACIAYVPSASADGQPTETPGWTVAPDGPTSGTPTAVALNRQLGASAARAALSGIGRIDGVTAGKPVLVDLTDGTLSDAGLTLSRRLDAPVPPGSRAALAYYDATHDAWTAVPTRMSADRTTLTATVGRPSYWTDIRVGAAPDTRVPAPDCGPGRPAWLTPKDMAVVDDGTAPMRWCTGRDPRDSGLLVVKIRADRGAGLGLTATASPTRMSTSDSGDVLVGVMTGALRLPQDVGRGVLMLPGGAETVFTFTEEAVRATSGNPLIRADAGPQFMIAGRTYRSLTELDPDGDRPAAILAALIATARCGAVPAGDPLEAAASARECLVEHGDEIVDDLASALVRIRPAGRATSLGTSAQRTARRLWQVWAAGLPFGGGLPIDRPSQVSPGTAAVAARDLLSSPVPALCRHPAGRLRDGELPAVEGSPGYVTLSRDDPAPVLADLTGDGVGDAAAVVRCSAGGAAWPDTVVFHGPGPTLLGSADLWRVTEADNFEHSTVTSLTADGADVVVRWTTTDGCCSNPKSWSARLHWDGRAVRILAPERA